MRILIALLLIQRVLTQKLMHHLVPQNARLLNLKANVPNAVWAS